MNRNSWASFGAGILFVGVGAAFLLKNRWWVWLWMSWGPIGSVLAVVAVFVGLAFIAGGFRRRK